MRILGIDPGQTGAVAVLDTGGVRFTVQFFDTPLIETRVGKKTRHEYNEAAMAKALREHGCDPGCETMCILERVSSMPEQGVVSVFNFGMGFGIWRGILSALQIPYTLVHPATWKTRLMKDMPREKDAARLRAIQLYPRVADQLSRKKDIGRADALLLAHYGLCEICNMDAPATDAKAAGSLF